MNLSLMKDEFFVNNYKIINKRRKNISKYLEAEKMIQTSKGEKTSQVAIRIQKEWSVNQWDIIIWFSEYQAL